MKSGFIAIVGRPNVGKSTLMNKLISEKLAIISDKAGTTRDKIRGISNIGENQYIFVDTPGIHKPLHLLGEYMTNTALESLEEVDVILFILDGTQEISTGDLFILEHIKKVNTPYIIVINKIDLLSDEEIKVSPEEVDSVIEKLDKSSEIFVYSDKPEVSKAVCKKLGLDGYTIINLIEPFNTTKYRNAFYNKNDYVETQADQEASSCG